MSIISLAMHKSREKTPGRRERAQRTDPEPILEPERDLSGKSVTQVQSPDSHVLEGNRILRAITDQGVQDAYNLLRTQILQLTKPMGWNTLMITSVGPKEGKTISAINLGMSMAMDTQQTCLLVDTHLRKPKVHAYLDLETDKGLTDYLLSDTPVHELLVNPGMDQFVVLPSGRALSSSTDILKSPKMASLVKELKTRYHDRYVIFDCPHILNMPDALVFSSYVDGVILLVDADRTQQQDIESALDVLQQSNLIGMVMNKVR